jgi:UDP-N-acetylmuramoyl-tripeptide--D-alanyl-D-alanine ligase
LKLEKVIEYMKADASALDPALLTREVGSFAIDSREVRKGDVFFALSQPEYSNNGFNGDFDDSTKFVPAALELGATAVVAREDRLGINGLDHLSRRAIFTDDSIRALQTLAHGVFLDWNKPVVAITGSAGKTTAKELTSHVLSASGRKVLRNVKNYNNGLGHPLTVLRLANDSSYDVAVLEMGMSTPMHEIRRLCEITPPDVAVVLNVLPVHVEHLGSIDNVARAKAEIVEGMKRNGVSILNADDPRVADMQRLAPATTITYGLEVKADVRAEDIEYDRLDKTTYKLVWQDQSASVRLPLNGKHNVSNSLAAAAVGIFFGMSLDEISDALSSVKAANQRGAVIEFERGFTVIDDSYNSNPEALLSMVKTVVDQRGFRRKIIVAGEMLELGAEEVNLHREAGRKIAATGVDKLIGVRGLGRELVAGAIEGGLKDSHFAEDSNAAADLLCDVIDEGDLVLVKGSRGVRTEKVIERLNKAFRSEGSVSEKN